MKSIIDFFEFYTESLDWEVIPILPNSKIPFQRGWNKGYNRDKTRSYLEQHSECNIGLRLGKIIDVEADSTEANNLLNSLTRGYEHPMYKSEKSIHHLFSTPDEQLTRIVIHGIEFRGNLHQSVLPPSINANGIEYTWIEHPGVSMPPLPEPLVNLYNKHNKMMLGARTGNVVEPWCIKCATKSRPIHWKRYKLEVKAFESLGKKWQCHKCRDVDVRPICRKMRTSRLST